MNSVKSSKNFLKMSYQKQVKEVVDEISDFKDPELIECYWASIIKILQQTTDINDRERILKNIYSISIRIDQSISESEKRKVFFNWISSGFEAISKNVDTINRVLKKPERIMKKLWITAKVLIILIKSLVRYSRKCSLSVNYKNKKYELQHLLQSFEKMILGDGIVGRLKSGESLNSTNLSLAISTCTLKFRNAFQPIFAKIYQDNIENNNSSELNPKCTPNNCSFKNFDGPCMHFCNLKIKNEAVWKIIIGDESNDNKLSNFDDVSDSKCSGSDGSCKLFKSPEKQNTSFRLDTDLSQSITKDSDSSNEQKRTENGRFSESNIVPRCLSTTEEFCSKEFICDKEKSNFKQESGNLTVKIPDISEIDENSTKNKLCNSISKQLLSPLLSGSNSRISFGKASPVSLKRVKISEEHNNVKEFYKCK